MNTSASIISLLLNTPCNADQARVFAAAKREIERLGADALLGAETRRHMFECEHGWQVVAFTIPGNPLLQSVSDALQPAPLPPELAQPAGDPVQTVRLTPTSLKAKNRVREAGEALNGKWDGVTWAVLQSVGAVGFSAKRGIWLLVVPDTVPPNDRLHSALSRWVLRGEDDHFTVA
ncbi:hypothetical protein [Ottowia sp.]|uniref:hypothetical protein n=1 Tax=Ottowia sp. TaxID=1898956 RepID=UPI0025D16EDA|nr:hypothetical protein [Ottowia sp.]MBK6616275.1 hypothetical protein [Ottowia sp.]